MDLPKKLKYARKKIGYKLLDVSRKTGIRYSDLCRFEQGTQEPKISELSTLAECYKRSIEFFLSKEKPKEETMLWCR